MTSQLSLRTNTAWSLSAYDLKLTTQCGFASPPQKAQSDPTFSFREQGHLVFLQLKSIYTLWPNSMLSRFQGAQCVENARDSFPCISPGLSVSWQTAVFSSTKINAKQNSSINSTLKCWLLLKRGGKCCKGTNKPLTVLLRMIGNTN